MRINLTENIFFHDVLNFPVSTVMLVVIVFCITLPEVVMNCLCECIKLRGCVGLDVEGGGHQRHS
jgi:hypothetical protein